MKVSDVKNIVSFGWLLEKRLRARSCLDCYKTSTTASAETGGKGDMCGIVGIVGHKPVSERLVEALERLEYRGYDSAGIATIFEGELHRRRAEGKLRNLKTRLKKEPLSGAVGIAHTRWATHGAPTECNAHPHFADGVAVVHNGIIENFSELKDALAAVGAKFQTDTDTEVIAHLLTKFRRDGMPRGIV